MSVRSYLRRPSVAVNTALSLAIVGGSVWAYETLHVSGGGTVVAAAQSTAVQQGTVTKTVTATGSVASAGVAAAAFATSGTVTEIDVHVGQLVKKGQLLAKIDPAASKRTLAVAEVDLDAANLSLSQAEDAGSDTSSPENSVAQAKAAMTAAETAVDGCTLTAPMAGTVTAVNGTLGGTSSDSSSSGFVEIQNLAKLEVSASFAEADATSLKAGQAATITWTALDGAAAPGKVTAIDPSSTTTNSVVEYAATLSVTKVPAGARIGQSVSVAVTTGTAQNALFVESAAITTVGTQHTVTVVSNGQQQTRTVKIGLVGDNTTQITSGLTTGEEVVVKATTSGSGSNSGSTGGGGLTGGGIGGAGGGPP